MISKIKKGCLFFGTGVYKMGQDKKEEFEHLDVLINLLK